MQQTVGRRTEPIGVEGDAPTIKKGGISEADSIVKEARKSMDDAGKGTEEDEMGRVSKEIIKEEEDKEPGPELDPNGAKRMIRTQQEPRA